jgi:hypothetical protein
VVDEQLQGHILRIPFFQWVTLKFQLSVSKKYVSKFYSFLNANRRSSFAREKRRKDNYLEYFSNRVLDAEKTVNEIDTFASVLFCGNGVFGRVASDPVIVSSLCRKRLNTMIVSKTFALKV